MITGTFNKIPKKKNSHGYGWARTWSENLDVGINHEGDPVDVLYLDHGVNFGGSLNLFGGFTDDLEKRINNFLEARLVYSLDIDMPDYGAMLKKRKDVLDKDWCDKVSEKCATAKRLKSTDISDLHWLTIGDSHTAAYAKERSMVIKTDGLTLFGQTKSNFEYVTNHIMECMPKGVTMSFGNIDLRHHVCRLNIDIEKKFKEGNLSKDELTKDIKYWEYSIVDIDNKNYQMANIKTELINSDYNTRFNINLSNVSKILKNEYNIYNSYKPDEYPGVLTKYYYNENYKNKGICYCTPHCSTKDKKSICCKITISIFRPGSIIITGAKTIEQLNHTYSFINNVLEKHFNKVQGIDIDDDNKTNQLNNEIRKISRKPRLFYIKRDNIKTINT